MEIGFNKTKSFVFVDEENNLLLTMTDDSSSDNHDIYVPLRRYTAVSSSVALHDPNNNNVFSSDGSLTDFLFDDDINLNEPLPLISSSGPEESTATIPPQDSWNQPADDPLLERISRLPFAGSTSIAPTTAVLTAPEDSFSTPVQCPNRNDVLLGRGGRNNQWSGNEMLRTMAKLMAEQYALAHKRDKPGLAWILVTQMRQLDPPTRFLKQHMSSGVWFEVSDDVAKEKASQCLRDIVAVQKTGVGRKRAFASAPELVAAKRQAAAAVTAVAAGQQNATFNTFQLGQSRLNPLLNTNNPFLAMMGSSTTATTQMALPTVRPSLPPKSISCVSLGGSRRTTSSSFAPMMSSNSNRTIHQDPLLRQLQLIRAQQQQQPTTTSTMFQKPFNAQFSLQMLQQQQQQQPTIVNQASCVRQSLPNANFGTANATWNLPQQQQPRPTALVEPLPSHQTIRATSLTERADTAETDEDAALKRWIDRLAEEDF